MAPTKDHFYKKYHNKPIEDWGTTCSAEAKGFYKCFKNYLKRNLPGATIDGFKANHYDASGFVIIDGKCIYVSHNLNRMGHACYADFDSTDPLTGVLYREAKDTHDYRGGSNHFTSIAKLPEAILAMAKGGR